MRARGRGAPKRLPLHPANPRRVESTAACAAGIQTELELTQAALRDRNPKSYPTWHHRQWLATLCLAGKAPGVTDGDAAAEGDTAPPAWVARCAGAMSVEAELELCGQFLALDERNFHCWNYRRALVQLGGVDLASELQFTDTLIKRNFSNYSAWQYRASLLTALGRVDVETLAGEFDTLKQAMFTEPDDQTAWFYHRWCVRAGQAHVASTPSDAEAWTAHLAVQCTALQELRALEPASKCTCRRSALHRAPPHSTPLHHRAAPRAGVPAAHPGGRRPRRRLRGTSSDGSLARGVLRSRGIRDRGVLRAAAVTAQPQAL